MLVKILGPLEVRDSTGTSIEVTGARLRALLARLALDAGRPVSASALVDAVWGESPPAAEANALQTLVSRLRRALGGAAVIGQSAAGYRLPIDPSDVDAHRFESLAAEGASALRRGDAVTALALLRDALELWRGPALADAGEFARPWAARLDDRRLAAHLDRISAELALGDAESVLTELDALAADHPTDERITVQHITALARAGRPADALRAYERARERLADELGVDPSPELQAVHLAVLRGELGQEQPTRPARRTNLKAQLTSFVGRDEEVRRVEKALQENRLVTLVGPGGAGKTRLAGEAAARLDAEDGVWLAELAPVTDGADVGQTVLSALGLREKQLLDRRTNRAGAQDAEGRLVDVLIDKQAVVVLDNCEHLIEASARLAESLLTQCPGLRVLTTSREPLAITGEVLLPVPPLGQPEADAPAQLALEFPAVRLFADRAAAAAPEFVICDDNVAVVIDIVRRLDGLPLAIELAAARLRTLTLDEIAARLSDRFRLLTGGSRTALPRHRTLRAVVEWSWDLLTEPERRVVERLAIFPAGVTAESASAVAGDGDVPADDVPDLIGSLIDKSLLQRVGSGERVRMLETIREFGTERLAERGELAEVRGRHADYFAALLSEAESHFVSADQMPWIIRLSDERENILAALRFRCDSGDADGALRIAVDFGGYNMLIGNHAEIAPWMAEALAVPGPHDHDAHWIATALLAMNDAATGTDPAALESGMSRLTEVVEHLAHVDVDQHPLIALLRPAIAFFGGQFDVAEQVLNEGLQNSHPWVRAAVRMFRANMAENNGDMEMMRADTEIALAEFRQIGERWGLASTLRSRGLLHMLDGELDEASAAYDEALELMSQMQAREDEAFLLVRLADLAIRRGDHARARELAEQARISAEETGSPVESVFTLAMLADIDRHNGDLERARALQVEAHSRIVQLPAAHPIQAHGRAIVLAMSARMALEDENLDEARELGRDAYAAACATRDMPIVAAVGMVLIDIAMRTGSAVDAAEMLGAAARLRGAEDSTSPDVIRLTAALSAALGDTRFAERYSRGRALDRDGALLRLDPDRVSG